MLKSITTLNSANRAVRDAKAELIANIVKMGQPEDLGHREIHILINKPWKLHHSTVQVMQEDGKSYVELDAVVNSYVSDDNVVVFDVYDCCMHSMDGDSAYIILSKANQLEEIDDSIICRNS